MNLERRIKAFSYLGETLRKALSDNSAQYAGELSKLIHKQQYQNSWFTPENVRTALSAIAHELTTENLESWTNSYPALAGEMRPLRVGLIFAGNIPAAGFHDFISVLISGNKLIAKTSSKDPDLIPFFAGILTSSEPGFSEMIEFTSGIMQGFDAVIATGSNNSSRYFEYYFSKYPHIIRKNRNSIAILDGTETGDELNLMGKDIFTYFGLGCRNVSKIYVPENYDITSLPETWKDFSGLINHSRYANNYDYNKAVYLVNRLKFLDPGFVLMREDERLASPVSVLYYEYYASDEILQKKTSELKDYLQCISGSKHVPFGQSQMPHLWDYADGIDTIEFLLKKNTAGVL